MINEKSGELLIEAIPLKLGSKFERQHFFAYSITNKVKIFIENESYCSFHIGTYEINNLLMNVSLHFNGKGLKSVKLIHQNLAESGIYWADHSGNKELHRKTIHDKWLASQLDNNHPYVYDWGKIYSGYDEKFGGSSIIIRY